MGDYIKNALHRQTSERNSAIELLRIFAGMAVVVLHYNFGSINAVEQCSGMAQTFLLIMEAICSTAVNIFLIISGYCNVNKNNVNIGRLLSLLIQTSVFSFCAALSVAIFSNMYSLEKLIQALIPVNYFVILYVSLMLISPFINIVFCKLHNNDIVKLLVILFLVLSVYPTAEEVFEEVLGKKVIGLNSISINGSGDGYTLINFMLIYSIGCGVRKLNLAHKINLFVLCVITMITVVIIYKWHYILPETAYMYCNPIVIIEACVIFLLFARYEFYNQIINIIAKAAFTCYLIHGKLLDKWAVLFMCNEIGALIIKILTLVTLVYFASMVIMKVWLFFYNPIYIRIIRKIPVLEIKDD